MSKLFTPQRHSMATEYALVSAACPMPSLDDRVAHSFCMEQLKGLAALPETVMIVHRGQHSCPAGFRRIHNHIEVGMLFSHRTRGPRAVTSEELLQQLNGRARSTENTDGIQIVRHGGALNVAALGKIVRDVSGYPLCKDAGLIFPSYQSLATEADRMPGALAIGLRGACATHPNLECVTVDTLDPTNPDDLPRYPLRDCVNIYVRFNANEVALEKAKKFLDRVVCRIAQDQQLLLRRSRPLQVAA